MVREKTAYGVINKSLLGELFHNSFSSDFKNLIDKEEWMGGAWSMEVKI